jgi:predicted enzyme related to lactoylglutathione lyase
LHRYLAHLVDAAALLSAQEGLDAIIQRVLLRLRRQLLNMNREERKWKKVAGIGGLFFRAHDPKALGSWYLQHLGIELTPTSEGAPVWQQEAGPTVFGPFPEKTGYFGDPNKVWMVNFRVHDLDKMVTQLRIAGIEVKVDPQSYPHGRFARLHDPEGNPIELWQPS